MGGLFAACAISRLHLDQPPADTFTFTWATPPAASATGLCRMKVHSKSTWPGTWKNKLALSVKNAIRHLNPKLFLGDTSSQQNVEMIMDLQNLKNNENRLVTCFSWHISNRLYHLYIALCLRNVALTMNVN
jgi:hypothetical protein